MITEKSDLTSSMTVTFQCCDVGTEVIYVSRRTLAFISPGATVQWLITASRIVSPAIPVLPILKGKQPGKQPLE